VTAAEAGVETKDNKESAIAAPIARTRILYFLFQLQLERTSTIAQERPNSLYHTNATVGILSVITIICLLAHTPVLFSCMSFITPRLGIDLGTANTLVFIPGRGVVLNEPSVVAISEIDKRILAVGAEAKEMIGRTPGEIIAYRPMKDGVIADYRVTQAMLRYFINKAMGRFQLFKPEVMVSVPTGVTSTERRAVVEAAIRAGAKSAYVVKESVLAAIGAGIPIQEARGHMVIDIGGGTSDVAVISLGGIVASTSVKCAGRSTRSSSVARASRRAGAGRATWNGSRA
jgi:actin-like ATPase involved in cell morphogenesis